jgi:hypothetical protein
VNKKQQKNFMKRGHAGFTASGPNEQKFLRRFFKKRRLSSSAPDPYGAAQRQAISPL